MKKLLITLFCIGALAACSGEPPVAVEYANLCQPENDKKTVAVDGYLSTGMMLSYATRGGDKSANLQFSAAPEGEKFVLAEIPVGTGSNQMEELPRGFKKQDLKIKTDGGATVGTNDRVRLTALAKTKSDALNAPTQPCYLKVSRIEKL